MKIYVSVSKQYSNTDTFEQWLLALESIHKDIVVSLYKDVDRYSEYIKDTDIVIVYLPLGYNNIGKGCYEEIQMALKYAKPLYISGENVLGVMDILNPIKLCPSDFRYHLSHSAKSTCIRTYTHVRLYNESLGEKDLCTIGTIADCEIIRMISGFKYYNYETKQKSKFLI